MESKGREKPRQRLISDHLASKKNTGLISYVIPTRNEPEIETLIEEIRRVMRNLRRRFEVIVIDRSDDDTSQRASKAGAKVYSQVSTGLGGALMEGFQKARGELVFTMDADLSHDPQYIPRFLKEVESGFDVVVGSRKMPGGGAREWGLSRKLISSVANAVGRWVAGVNVSDLTSGYRVYRAKAVRSLNPNLFKAKGFSFQLEILFHLLRKGFKATSIPIIFVDRKAGRSKLTRREVSEFLRTAFRLLQLRVKYGC
jgi:dolichol-phosphate mannosyltransferase